MESALYSTHALVVSVSEMSQLVREFRTRALPCVRYMLIYFGPSTNLRKKLSKLLFNVTSSLWKYITLSCFVTSMIALDYLVFAKWLQREEMSYSFCK